MFCEIQNPDNENLGFYLVGSEGTLDVLERGTTDFYLEERVLSDYNIEDRLRSRECEDKENSRRPLREAASVGMDGRIHRREGFRIKMLTGFLVQPEAAIIASLPNLAWVGSDR